ncbi:MAG TPA: hypothetical protein VIW26_08525 [Gemmatimonadales bacterium]|jgi:hypothetical protein
MRTLAILLVAAGSFGAMALGGRAIAADRIPGARHRVAPDSAVSASAAPVEGRVWYGGTLAPIVVQATGHAGTRLAQKAACPQPGAN